MNWYLYDENADRYWCGDLGGYGHWSRMLDDAKAFRNQAEAEREKRDESFSNCEAVQR